jgi:hypothetical protein
VSGFKNNRYMKRATVLILLICGSMGVLSILSCVDKKNYPSPPGYNLNSPVKYKMPDDLAEVSGIAFRNGKADSLYAEEDESGRVYYFKPGDKTLKYSKFGKSGDYEDIAILGDKVILLRSDGTLFVFAFKDLRNPQIPNVQRIAAPLPKGEYEGMYADEKEGLLYVLCKNSGKNAGKQGIVTAFKFDKDTQLIAVKNADIRVSEIEAIAGQKGITFRPSALAKNPLTNEWYVVSSVNKCIVVTDVNFKVKAVYALNPSLFLQPEGIAFDNQNNLYISNEGDKISPGTVLKFNYKK